MDSRLRLFCLIMDLGFVEKFFSAVALQERTFGVDVNCGFIALVLYPPGLACAGGETYESLPHLAV